MNKLIITSAILLISAASFAQSKKPTVKTDDLVLRTPVKPQYQKIKVLPPLATIKLTPAQILRIDSAISVINNNVDSKNTSKWIITSFTPVFEQASKQLVPDSVLIQK